MEWLAVALLLLFSVVGVAAIFVTSSGTLIILLGAVCYAAMTGWAVLPLKAVLLLVFLYLFGELLEYGVTFLGAKTMGASTPAAFGALVGGGVGALLGLCLAGVGVVAGMAAGLFLGAFLIELMVKRDVRRSVQAGVGGLLGRAGSIVAKLAIALAMFAVIALHIAAG